MDLGLSFRTSKPSQGRQRRVQSLHFSVHALSFLPQFPDYSRQVRHSPPRTGIVPTHRKSRDSQAQLRLGSR